MAAQLSEARLKVLRSHADVDPRAVGWSIGLCAYGTWDWLYKNGYLAAGRLTERGRTALAEAA